MPPSALLLLPPADLARRTIPSLLFDVQGHGLLRSHQAIRDPIFYNRKAVSHTEFRFDAPDDEYGVLYAAPAFETCVTETVIRARFQSVPLPLMLSETELGKRCISALTQTTPRPLKLADLTKPVWDLGLSLEVLSSPSYAASTAWSLAIWNHPAQFDGIYFISRYANAPSLAVFDRARLIAQSPPVNLLAAPQLGPFLDQYRIALVP